jgi:hypothetical protein
LERRVTLSLRETLGIVTRSYAQICEAAAIGAAVLLLPAALIDLVFGTDLLGLLAQVALVSGAIAAIVIVGARAGLTPDGTGADSRD